MELKLKLRNLIAEKLDNYNNVENSENSDWQILSYDVMGGLSQRNFKIEISGYGVFYGDVSIENNGGFSSIKYSFDSMRIDGDSKIRITLKDDGKEYRFRIKDNITTSQSYITIFSSNTNDNWQEIEISIKDLSASFRGRKWISRLLIKHLLEKLHF